MKQNFSAKKQKLLNEHQDFSELLTDKFASDFQNDESFFRSFVFDYFDIQNLDFVKLQNLEKEKGEFLRRMKTTIR